MLPAAWAVTDIVSCKAAAVTSALLLPQQVAGVPYRKKSYTEVPRPSPDHMAGSLMRALAVDKLTEECESVGRAQGRAMADFWPVYGKCMLSHQHAEADHILLTHRWHAGHHPTGVGGEGGGSCAWPWVGAGGLVGDAYLSPAIAVHASQLLALLLFHT